MLSLAFWFITVSSREEATITCTVPLVRKESRIRKSDNLVALCMSDDTM